VRPGTRSDSNKFLPEAWTWESSIAYLIRFALSANILSLKTHAVITLSSPS